MFWQTGGGGSSKPPGKCSFDSSVVRGFTLCMDKDIFFFVVVAIFLHSIPKFAFTHRPTPTNTTRPLYMMQQSRPGRPACISKREMPRRQVACTPSALPEWVNSRCTATWLPMAVSMSSMKSYSKNTVCSSHAKAVGS